MDVNREKEGPRSPSRVSPSRRPRAVDDIFFFFSLFIRADNDDDDDDDVGDFMDKQTNTYDICMVVGFPLTCKNNYNLLEAREARDEIIL